MANKKAKKAKKEKPAVNEPWIQMQTGIRIIAMVSILLGVWTGYQAVQVKGLVEGILWGFIFGLSIWVIFFGGYLFNRWVRGGKS